MIAPDPSTIVFVMLLGGAVAVDGTSFGQFMLSRPFVAATLAGVLVGMPAQGALIGLVLEAFHLTVLPVGAAKYPEGGPAAVAGGAMFATSGGQASALVLTVLAALLMEWVGGESVRYLRQANKYLVPVETGDLIEPARLERRHLAAIGCDFLRGVLLVGGGLLLISTVLRFVEPLWGVGSELPQALIGAMVAGLIASSLRLVGSRVWFAALGAVAGLAFLFLAA